MILHVVGKLGERSRRRWTALRSRATGLA